MTTPAGGALPNLVIVGAMKCGTTSLHRYLGQHPQVAVSEPKELDFFVGPEVRPAGPDGTTPWAGGNWHRGVDWYASRFPAEAVVRVDSSPGYTSPAHPEVADRLARVLPDATLVLCVREPFDRAVSQHRHHRRDGTEPRALEDALLDPDSQYVARSRYHERITPLADRVGWERIEVVEHEELRTSPRAVVERLLARFPVTEPVPDDGFDQRHNAADGPPPAAPPGLRAAFEAAVRDDVERLRAATGRPLWPHL